MSTSIRILFYSTCSVIYCNDRTVCLKTVQIDDADLEDKAMIFFCINEPFEVKNDVVTHCPTRTALYSFLSRKHPIEFSRSNWVVHEIPNEYMNCEVEHGLFSSVLETEGLDTKLNIDPTEYDVIIKAPYLEDPDANIFDYHLNKWRSFLQTEKVPSQFRQIIMSSQGIKTFQWN